MLKIAHRKHVWFRDGESWDTLTNVFSCLAARQWGYAHSELLFTSGEAASSMFSIQSGQCEWPPGDRPKGGPAIFKRKYYPSWEWDFTPLPHIDRDAEHRIIVLAMHEIDTSIHAGAGYDRAGVLRFVLPFVKEHPRDWFCSEFVVHLLQSESMFHDQKAWTCSPNKLYRLCKKLG